MELNRKLKMGMVGGGRDAFIGAVHRKAALMDGKIEFIAGALSSDPEKAKASARDLLISEERSYGTWQEMVDQESNLPESERIDFVSIVTPNFMHFPIAKGFAEVGINVICDKPMTYSLQEAKDLVDIVKDSGIVFALSHNYTGYPMVKQARHMVRTGELGDILKIVVEYPQSWLLKSIEEGGQKQASWRTDPKRSGISNCMGDIGSHCENLAHYITGLEIIEMCADLRSILNRPLDNDGNILLHFEKEVSGILHASQFSAGEENNLRIRVYGTKGSLEWHQEEPNYLWFRTNQGPAQLYRRGNAYLCDAAQRATRLPPGHPEAFIEAFANIYANATDAMRAKILGQEPDELVMDFPTVIDGARGLAFIESAVESGRSNQKWYPMKAFIQQ
ncbi:MAG: Gfo/Idh/MocA family oxidoreductase [Desulfobacteraceae bacterium]|mgnify:CR=1 FL=1|jgi:predicted dehydrogenase|nr:Gfo/Idh/MocA family oxidoreductase [Desulfobacteraceae bacterium]